MVTIRNISEAKALAPSFPHLITAGPKHSETTWGHPHHMQRTFLDVSIGPYAATLADIAHLLAFATDCDGPILIHCHRGESRSTALGIGCVIQTGVPPVEAVDMLRNGHPVGRPFTPTPLIIEHVATLLACPELMPMFPNPHRLATTRSW